MICLRRLTRVNIVSQMLHRLGFMRLIFTPSIRSGIESGPRIGMGMLMCCQHPLQIVACDCVMDVIGSRSPMLAAPAGLNVVLRHHRGWHAHRDAVEGSL